MLYLIRVLRTRNPRYWHIITKAMYEFHKDNLLIYLSRFTISNNCKLKYTTILLDDTQSVSFCTLNPPESRYT